MIKIDDKIVYSNDVLRIMNGNNPYGFNYRDNGIIVPKDIKEIESDFESVVNKIYNNCVEIIEQDAMSESLWNSTEGIIAKLPIVSLDKIYLSIDNKNVLFLDCTRLDGSEKLVSRNFPNESEMVNYQIMYISELVKSRGINEIVLADDVVYSGKVLKRVIELFYENGIVVVGIRSAVATENAYNYFNMMLPLGLECGYILGDNVLDQICQRDFYFGILGSGILKEKDGNLFKAPYFLPYGDCVVRASIPAEYEKEFSEGCLRRSELLWCEIERLSNRRVYLNELPEVIIDTDINNSVVDEIQAARRRFK